MKAVMISIQPKWVEKIVSGEKTIEVRKTAPKLETPFKCFIYMTQNGKMSDFDGDKNKLSVATFLRNSGKVIGEFMCDKIEKIPYFWEFPELGYDLDDDQIVETCLTREELMNYGKRKPLYGLHIFNLKIYDKPKELGEFRKPCSDKYIKKYKYCQGCKHGLCADLADCWNTVNCPPQSWCYVEI